MRAEFTLACEYFEPVSVHVALKGRFGFLLDFETISTAEKID
jgi:hypothetical protein